MAKGSNFERVIAKQLSLWITDGKRDDVVWRTQNSGGRATFRKQKGRTLEGQYGDLTYTDPLAKPFFDECMVECKRGYGKWSVLDLIDKGPHAAGQQLEKWLRKMEEDREAANVPYAILIAKRDQRKAVIVINDELVLKMKEWYGTMPSSVPSLLLELPGSMPPYAVFSLKEFLDHFQPDFFSKAGRER
jgi:hypothetical protein